MTMLKAVADMTYPGRMIIIGRDTTGTYDIVVYAITGRSPASQARKFEFYREKLQQDRSLQAAIPRTLSNCEPRPLVELHTIDNILVKPSDKKTLSRGDPELLIYPAVTMEHGICVSNGKQTLNIMKKYERGRRLADVLKTGLRNWTYEPDAPHFTPRISGFILPGSDTAALSILKSGDEGETIREFFEISMLPGLGRMISTYAGDNENPLPSFRGEPLSVELAGNDEREVAEAVYDALGPQGGNDLRVAVGVVFARKDKTRHHIINRCEREG